MNSPRFLLKLHFIVLVTFLPLFSLAGKISIEQQCLDIHHRYLKESFELTKHCVGFSAPVSARAYSYVTLAMYESCVEILPQMQTLSGQLNGFERKVFSPSELELFWPLVVNSADNKVLSYFYRNMPPANLSKLKIINDSLIKRYGKRIKKAVREASIRYGESIATEIIEWSKTDGADEGFNANYPESFEAPACESCWTKTTPGYFSSLQPYWGSNRLHLAGSDNIVESCVPMEFSFDPSSVMYRDAMALYQFSKSKSPEVEIIAEYWDDAPGYSGTPSGHFFSLAQSLVIDKKLTLDSAIELYVKLGVALNEAFVNCWKLKYTYNFIRPITYIHRYIDPQFNTYIATPSFPEFPSGHSFQSGAGTEVLKAFFTDEIRFTDSTNIYRVDIDGRPRSFNSITELGEEISMSRYYGGIHFLTTLNTSLAFGKSLGYFVVTSLKCRK